MHFATSNVWVTTTKFSNLNESISGRHCPTMMTSIHALLLNCKRSCCVAPPADELDLVVLVVVHSAEPLQSQV